jgi:ferrous-iron efflux pump FieF
VAIVILGSVRAIVLRSLDILLDRELPAASRAEILKIAKSHEDVLGVHDLRTRTSGTHEFIQFHLELDPELSLRRTHTITDEVEWAVMARFPRAEVIIHADPYGLVEPQDDF